MESLVVDGVPVVAERGETANGRPALSIAVQPSDGPWTEVTVLLDGTGGIDRLITRHGRDVLESGG